VSLSQPARPGAPVTQVSKALATSTPFVANDGVRPFADAGVSPLSGAHSLHARILLSLLEDRDLVPRAGSGVVRMDPLRFLAGCRTR